VATYKLDKYIAEAEVEPFILEVDEERSITITYPTGEVIAQLTETPAHETRRIVQLLCGDQFEEVWKVIGPLPSSVLLDVATDIVKHFRIGQVQRVPGGQLALPR
jgi:hypothetical protein